MALRDSVALVTGAAGFVGANLVRRLLDLGAGVHVAVRPSTDPWRLADVRGRVRWHAVDLTDRTGVAGVMANAAPNVVFHLAKHRGSPATMDYHAALDGNLVATLHLLEAARDRPVRRFVHTGSSLEYDLNRSPLREDAALAPVTVHGVTRAAATLLAQHFARREGVPAVVLRLFTVYGPWEAPARFVPTAVMAALDGRPLAVTPPGFCHDWVYVDDVVDACLRAATADGLAGEVLNVATGRQTPNEEIVRHIEEAAGVGIVRAPVAFEARPWDTARWVADVSRARDLLGWRAETDVASGLARTLAWFRKHADSYRLTHV